MENVIQILLDYVRWATGREYRLAADEKESSFGWGMTQDELIQFVLNHIVDPEVGPNSCDLRTAQALLSLCSYGERLVIWKAVRDYAAYQVAKGESNDGLLMNDT